jgi:hypothetical protein
LICSAAGWWSADQGISFDWNGEVVEVDVETKPFAEMWARATFF